MQVLDAPEQVDFSTNLCDTYRKTKASFEEKVEQSLKYLTAKGVTDETYQPGRPRQLGSKIPQKKRLKRIPVT
jgi:hypothetical protein